MPPWTPSAPLTEAQKHQTFQIVAFHMQIFPVNELLATYKKAHERLSRYFKKVRNHLLRHKKWLIISLVTLTVWTVLKPSGQF